MASPCLYFMRGSCRFGNRCWNSHDLGSARSQSSLQYQLDSSDDELSLPVVILRDYTSPSTSSPSSSASRPRQRNQVPPNSAKKPSETDKTEKTEKTDKTDKTDETVSQDKWSLQNNNTGETREGTPDSVLVETVKKLNEAENLVISLRQQLRIKNDGDNFSWVEHQIEQCIESDLQCNICYEMFIKPTVLNCTHTFCQYCIESWTRRVNHCPTCRVYVKNRSYCLTLDTYLDKISDCLPEEVKVRRESLKIERNNNRTNRVEMDRNRSNNRRRRNNRNNQSMRSALGALWGERDRDGAEWNIALEEALFDPIHLGGPTDRRYEVEDWDDLSDSTLDDRWITLKCAQME
ncbi:E3 ubiquitin-protein ligase RNF8-like isoform X2 [Melanaphis sacchari]|uniref:E3 ubiquitin-protein ligase RNF8-like isoform X2 n=1 Tax=Melanaphis sacchari TaxID=742174 RepID=UPI000DC15844|nr:E3 ubiquitin-protein ligase RNF8-like isoform X2 [Melanaphis sacchari]